MPHGLPDTDSNVTAIASDDGVNVSETVCSRVAAPCR